MNFNSHVDGIVATSAALVNAATPGEQQGREYTLPRPTQLAADIGAALHLGSPTATVPGPRQVTPFVTLAEHARPVFEQVEHGDVDAAARTVNHLLQHYAPTPYLDQHDGEPWHLHYHGPAATDRTGWGGAISLALATVLGGDYADRLGVCAAPVCDRVFVDVSRNGTRRFCCETCQNRVKAAAHRARYRQG